MTISKIKGETFLVTGGAGFIGSNLVRYLLENSAAKVKVLDNLSTGFKKNIEPFLKNTAFEFIEGDIRDLNTCLKSCEGVVYVLHQAALGSIPRSLANPIMTNEVNINGFLNMLVAVRDSNIKRFIYAASSSTYGDSKTLPKIEDVIGKPLSPYAVTKFVNELYAHVFGLNFGVQSIGLRYFNVFGPNQDPNGAYAAVIPLFIKSAFENTSPFVNGDGEQTRDFTYVGNVVRANIDALFTEKSGALNEVYNIAVGENITINKLFQTICELTGKSIEPIYRESRQGDIRNSLADISKARLLLGYDPQFKLREGLKLTIDWFGTNY